MSPLDGAVPVPLDEMTFDRIRSDLIVLCDICEHVGVLRASTLSQRHLPGLSMRVFADACRCTLCGTRGVVELFVPACSDGAAQKLL